MKLSIYQIDAFAEKPFEGNPAAVIPLESWLPEDVMAAIAEENNLAETAFFIPQDKGFAIRWFTPNRREAPLCGHATLASAFVLFECLGYEAETIVFDSLSGTLFVSRRGDGLLTLDFPTQPPVPCNIPDKMSEALGRMPTACLKAEDYVAVFEHHQDILDIEPDFAALALLDRRGVIVTAAAEEFDFVARFFVPKYGVPEDSVTGSAYTCLTPYWSKVLGKTAMDAKQVSARGGKLHCELQGGRVHISGKAVKYLQGEIEIDF